MTRSMGSRHDGSVRPHRILLIGTGRMAVTHAERFTALERCEVVGAVDLDPARAAAFAERHDIERHFGTIEAALAATDVDAVSVITPDPAHEAPVLVALEHGLPVLCEKPLSDSLEAAMRMRDAAATAAVPNLVNLTYRSSAALATARRLIDTGAIGVVRHVEASYLQSWLTSAYWGDWRSDETWLWRLSREHGSLGVLGDVGIHILDFVTAGTGLDVAGLQCRLHTFDKAAGGRIGDYTLDANDACVINVALGATRAATPQSASAAPTSAAAAQADRSALGVVHLSRFASGHLNTLKLSVHGTEGALAVRHDTEGDTLEVSLGEDRHAGRWCAHALDSIDDVFTRFRDALDRRVAGVVQLPATDLPDFAHATRLQVLLERCSQSHNDGRWLDLQDEAERAA